MVSESDSMEPFGLGGGAATLHRLHDCLQTWWETLTRMCTDVLGSIAAGTTPLALARATYRSLRCAAGASGVEGKSPPGKNRTRYTEKKPSSNPGINPLTGLGNCSPRIGRCYVGIPATSLSHTVLAQCWRLTEGSSEVYGSGVVSVAMLRLRN